MYAVEPELGSGRETAADALPADMAVPMLGPAPVLVVVVPAARPDRALSRLCIRRPGVKNEVMA